MAKINVEFYTGQDKYSDGDIENDMLAYAKNHLDIDEISLSDGRWPVFYHFSRLRENILNWYNFKEDCTILEVGAGCGALTGMLCKKAKRVYSNEMSMRRAEILYNRYININNLDIIVGSIMDVELEPQFDYVILMGVFEYSAIYCSSNSPYNDLLKKVKGFLKPDGRLIIGIENKFGIKYLSGAPEDHTGGFFDGINGYKNEKVRTFSRNEIINILHKAGFKNQKFYYPYPDYKFTSEVFTQETLNLFTGESGRIALPDADRFMLFNDNLILKNFIEEGVGDYFFNSFLIETSIDVIEDKERAIYVKINADRKPQFSISTIIESSETDSKKVYKIPLTDEAEIHLKNVVNNSNGINNSGFTYVSYEHKNKIINTDFISFPSMQKELNRLFSCNDFDGVWSIFDLLWIDLKRNSFWCDNIFTDEFKNIFGNQQLNKKSYLCINPANIDLTFGNIFLVQQKIYVIDAEWVFRFPIPIDFIFWRAVQGYFKDKNDDNNLFISINDVLNKYNINPNDTIMFEGWNRYFYSSYVKQGACIENFNKSVYNLDLRQVMEQVANSNSIKAYFYTYLYLDKGEGFSESTKLTQKVNCTSDIMKITFDIPQQTKNIRWDPIENEWCVCKVLRVYTDISELFVVPYNAISTDQGDVFINLDPTYNILGEVGNASNITIEFMIEIGSKCNMGEMLSGHINNLLNQKENTINGLLEKEKQMQLQLIQRETTTKKLNSEIKELQMNLSNKISEADDLNTKVRELTIQLTYKNSEADDLNTKIRELTTQLTYKNGEADDLKKQLDAITNSTSWKITKPLRKILGKNIGG